MQIEQKKKMKKNIIIFDREIQLLLQEFDGLLKDEKIKQKRFIFIFVILKHISLRKD